MKKRISVLLCTVILIVMLPAQSFAATVGGNYISSAGACVMDYETG